MSRKVLIVGSVMVLGLLVGLWLLLLRDDRAQAHAPVTVPTPTTMTPSPATGPQAGMSTTPMPRGTTPAPEPGSGAPREYAVGDTQIRDHRSGDQKPLDVPPNVHPAEGHMIQSTTTHAISQKVKEVMIQCTSGLAKEAKGDKPRLEGQILISIKNHQLAITSATMQLRNFSAEATESTKQCIESKSVGLQSGAAGETDVDNYTINISFAVP